MSMKEQEANPSANGGNGKHQSSQHESYEAWSGFYQQMADESMDLFQKGVSMAQKMTPFFPGAEVYKSWSDNYQSFFTKVGEEATHAPGDMDMVRRLYESWLHLWTSNLEGYMRTPEFAAKSGKDLEQFSEMQSRMGQMMESYWHALHLPSTNDMRELYHKLYNIERKFDDMDRRFREWEASSSATAKKNPQ